MFRGFVGMLFVVGFLSATSCAGEPDKDVTGDVALNNAADDTGQLDTSHPDVCGTQPDTNTGNHCGHHDAGADTGDKEPEWCPGYSEGEQPLCRDHDDCSDEAGHCYPPGEEPPCGACFQTTRDCEEQTDCGAGELCESYNPPCPCDTNEPSTRCVVDCRDDASACTDEEACDDEGFCQRLLCNTGGESCPTDASCAPADAAADANGCVRGACETDDDCSCGACVFGRCFEGPGRCELPRP